MSRAKTQAPKGRNNSAQGNALGIAAPGNQSPVGAAQISSAARHNGWRNTNLGAVIANIDTGKSFRCEERPPTESEVGVVKVSAVTWGTYNEEESKTCLDAARIEPRYLIEEGDFLFSRANTIQLIGACVIAGATSRRLMLSDKILRFRFTDEVEPRWVLHWLRSKQGRSEIERLSSGNQESMRNIGQERIRAIALPLPPLPDQRRIVAEIEKQFTRLEAGVAALRRVQANLKRYRAAVLKAACEGRLVPTEAELSRSGVPPLDPASTATPLHSKDGSKVSANPKRQDAASTFESGQQLLARILTERRQNWQGRGKYKEPEWPTVSIMPELPNGWTWATVDQLAAPEPNSITDGPFGSNLKTEHYTSIGPRVIRLQNIGDGVYVDEEAHITQEHFERLKKHRVFANDVVIAGFGENPPRCCVIPESLGPAIVKADCIRFKPHSDVLPKYMNAALNSDPVRKRTKGMVHGVGRPRLNLGEIKSIVLPLPSLAEQTRIVAEVERRLSVVEELEAVVTTNLQRATRLRQSILQKAFTGEL